MTRIPGFTAEASLENREHDFTASTIPKTASVVPQITGNGCTSSVVSDDGVAIVTETCCAYDPYFGRSCSRRIYAVNLPPGH
jgi:hypothetical protein